MLHLGVYLHSPHFGTHPGRSHRFTAGARFGTSRTYRRGDHQRPEIQNPEQTPALKLSEGVSGGAVGSMG